MKNEVNSLEYYTSLADNIKTMRQNRNYKNSEMNHRINGGGGCAFGIFLLWFAFIVVFGITKGDFINFLEGMNMSGFLMVIGIVLIICVIIYCVVIVPEQMEFIVEQLGKYHHTMRVGINFRIPLIQQIRNKVSLKEHIHDFPPQNVITKDNVSMKIDTVVYCKIFDSYKNTYMISDSVEAIEKITATTLRNIVGTMTLDEMLTARDIINNHLLKEVDEATDVWGIKITRIEVKDIMPPAEIKEAMDKQMKAEREKRAVVTDAEARKERDITVAEGQKQAVLMEAEAKAKAIELVAKAEAEAIRVINEQKPSEAYIKLQAIKSIKDMADGKATKIVVPSDMSSLTSNILAIKEMLTDNKDTKDDNKKV